MLTEAAFRARLAAAERLEGKRALSALLKLNGEILPHVSSTQYGYWLRVCEVWRERTGRGRESL